MKRILLFLLLAINIVSAQGQKLMPDSRFYDGISIDTLNALPQTVGREGALVLIKGKDIYISDGTSWNRVGSDSVTSIGENYISISSNVITANPIDLSSTNVTGTLPIANGGTNSSTIVGAKTNFELENVDNTSDLDKPVSTATQTELDGLESRRQLLSAGMIKMPVLTDNLDGTVDVASEEAVVFKTSDKTGGLFKYTIPSISNQVLTDNKTNYIVVNYNSGTPQYQIITDVSLINESDIIPVFTIYREGNELHKLDWDGLGSGLANKLNARLVKTRRFERQSGLTVTEFGTRNLTLTSGKVWYGGNEIDLTAVNSTIDEFFLYYHISGVWNKIAVTQWNNTQYDNGTDLVTISNNKYGVCWIYRGVESDSHMYMILGNEEYANVAEAEVAQTVADLPENISTNSMLVAQLIFQKNASTLAEVRSPFAIQFSSSSPTDHNNLSNLQLSGSGVTYGHIDDQAQSISGAKTFSDVLSVEAVSDEPLEVKRNNNTTGAINFNLQTKNSSNVYYNAAALTSTIYDNTNGAETSDLSIAVRESGTINQYTFGSNGSLVSNGFRMNTGSSNGQVITQGNFGSLNWGKVDLSSPDYVTGTLADGNLSSNVALKNIDNNFSVAQTGTIFNATTGIQTNGTTRIDNLGNYTGGSGSFGSKITINSTNSGDELIRFATDRQWAFKQEGIDSGTVLRLADLAGGKTFQIYDEIAGRIIAEFNANIGNKSYYQGSIKLETTSTGIDVTGGMVASGTVTATNFILSSDERLKNFKDNENIPDLDSVKIRKFNYKADSTKRDRYGVSAQELQKVAPEMVYVGTDSLKLLRVAYIDFLVAKMHKKDEQIKELQKQVIDQDKRLKRLENIMQVANNK